MAGPLSAKCSPAPLPSAHIALSKAALIDAPLPSTHPQDIAAKEGEIKGREEAAAAAAAGQAVQRKRRDDLLNRQRQLFKQDNELER